MANETTSGVWSNASLSYALQQGILAANTPRPIFLTNFFNEVDIDGLPSDTFNVPKATDLGAASAGTEGTEITANTSLALGGSASFTVVEGALVASNITKQAISQLYPGFSGVNEFVQSASFEQMLAVLQGPAMRHAKMCEEKAETDAQALLANISNTVGGGDGVDITLLNMLEAEYTLATLEPVNDEKAYFVTPHQDKELRAEMLTTSGGIAGTLWSSQADASMVNSGAPGRRGSLLGRPYFVGSHSTRYETVTVAYGCLACVGSGNPITGSRGAFCIVTRGGINHEVAYEPRKRGIDLVTAFEYIVGELDDSAAVAIVTDDA